jgi:hypothetical protein
MKLVPTLPPTRRLLFVVKKTHFHPRWEKWIVGRPVGEFMQQDLTTVQKAMVWKSYVQHFRANPRSILYMLKLAYDLVNEAASDIRVDLLTDKETSAAIPEPLRVWPHNLWTMPDLNRIPADVLSELRSQNYDTVIFLYSDAIGLRWGQVESQIVKLHVPNVLVLNGRKRLFVWDAEAQRLLGQRRVIESGCLLEIVLLPALVLVSIPLALYDTLNHLWRMSLASKGQNR